mgnify:CR=1 FL=1
MNSLRPILLLAALSCLLSPLPAAQQAGYRLPDQAIVDVLDAAPTPSVDFAPDGQRFLRIQRPAMPSIAEVAAPWEGLAGLRIVPELRSRRLLGLATGIEVQDVAGGAPRPIALPAGARLASWAWSPDSRRIALLLAGEQGLALWLADPTSGGLTPIEAGLNAVLGRPFGFIGSGTGLWMLVVDPAVEAPEASRVPRGPAVQETAGTSAPLRTYQDLLAGPEAEERFAYLATSRLVHIDLERGVPRTVGPAALIRGVEASPDGSLFLVQTVERPFSYVLPLESFPTRYAVWDLAGREVLRVVDRPLGDRIPMEGVPLGPRNVSWHPAEPSTLVWTEAQDGGDPARPAELRDIWYARAAPFQEPARELARLAHRASGLSVLSESSRLLVSEYDRDRRWTRTWLIDPRQPEAAPRAIEDRSNNDRYGDPGTPISIPNARGQAVVRERDGKILRSGPGHSPKGPRPFLAREDLGSGARELLWQSAESRYESLAALLEEGASSAQLVFASESANEPTNYFLWSTGQEARALTRFADPTPQLRQIRQELLTYQRADGVPLSGTLYLPAGYQEGAKLPLFIWAYPLEYNDAGTAGQVTNSTNRSLRMRGATHLALLLAGYAVLDNATMPIVGDPETMNETFIEQIVASAQAAIDACVARGVCEREHVAVGGHSYGAFMTANLLAHCDLFRAGIARSGAYNRSLTPFGFQSERRTLWQAPQTYVQLSPFFAADRIDEPLLMIHGDKDSNPGTFPTQSERLYSAVKGNGGVARLVMLPAEDHGYQARESCLHAIAEMIDWCERFVRPEPASPAEAAAPR